MRNPWLRSNPWMSMWLSGANVLFNTARAQAYGNAWNLIRDNHEQAIRAWSAPWEAPRAPGRTRSRKRAR